MGCLFKTTTEEKKTFKPSISEGYLSYTFLHYLFYTFCVNGFVYIYIYMRIYICIYIYIYIYIYIKRKGANADKHKFAVLLLFNRLIEARELWLFGHCELFVLVGLVVEFESVVGISEILFRLICHPIIRCDPIEKFASIFLMFGVSRIVGLESLKVPNLPDFFFLRGVGFVSR